MIARSRPVKLTALLLAAGAHAAMAVAMMPPSEVRTEGAAGSQDLRLGSSFKDMVQGVMTPEAAEVPTDAPMPTLDQLQTTQPTETPLEPQTATPSTPPQQDKALETGQAEPSQRVAPKSPTATKAQAANQVAPLLMAAARPAPTGFVAPSRTPLAAPQATPPIAPLKAARPAPQPPQATTTPEAQTAPPVTEAVKAEDAPPPEETLEATTPDNAAVARSLRPPPARSTEFETRNADRAKAFARAHAKPRPKPKAKAKTARAATGNSSRNARAGSSNGTRTGRSTSSGVGGSRKAAGNAAAANYGGIINSCVRSRAGNPRGNGRVVISFSVSGSGSIGGVSISQSSGNGARDRAAASAVRRVGRCPAPPAGARRHWSIGFQ